MQQENNRNPEGNEKLEDWLRPLEQLLPHMDEDKAAQVTGMVEALVDDINHGRNRRLSILLSKPEKAAELRSEMAAEIYHFTAGRIDEGDHFSGAFLHNLKTESEEAQLESPMETKAEELERKATQNESVSNFMQWKKILHEEEEGKAPPGSADGFLEDLREHKKPFPSSHEAHYLSKLMEESAHPSLSV
jgi:hypothetical protein